MHSIISLVLFCVSILVPSYSLAINPNSNLPIAIESDSATLDDSAGTSTYKGNVIISQGLSHLKADEITINTANRKIVNIQATGIPAIFVQQENENSPRTQGSSNNITYEASKNLVIFSGNAKLLQQENSFSGEKIEYDIIKRAIRAEGNSSEDTRVKIHYFPQNADSTSEQNSSIDSDNATP